MARLSQDGVPSDSLLHDKEGPRDAAHFEPPPSVVPPSATIVPSAPAPPPPLPLADNRPVSLSPIYPSDGRSPSTVTIPATETFERPNKTPFSEPPSAAQSELARPAISESPRSSSTEHPISAASQNASITNNTLENSPPAPEQSASTPSVVDVVEKPAEPVSTTLAQPVNSDPTSDVTTPIHAKPTVLQTSTIVSQSSLPSTNAIPSLTFPTLSPVSPETEGTSSPSQLAHESTNLSTSTPRPPAVKSSSQPILPSSLIANPAKPGRSRAAKSSAPTIPSGARSRNNRVKSAPTLPGVHENVMNLGQKVVGQGARAGEAVFGKARGYLATQKRLKTIMQQAKDQGKKIKELDDRLHKGASGVDEATLKQDRDDLRRRDNTIVPMESSFLLIHI